MSEDYDTLSDRSLLDLGLTKLGVAVLPNYFDEVHARRIRDRIAELGLLEKFTSLLGPLTKTNSYPAQIFAIMQLSPRQQMIAALRALGDTDGR